MKITAQEKIAELEQRIIELETRIANMRHESWDEFNKKHKIGRYEHDRAWFTKLCDVFFNGRAA